MVEDGDGDRRKQTGYGDSFVGHEMCYLCCNWYLECLTSDQGFRLADRNKVDGRS